MVKISDKDGKACDISDVMKKFGKYQIVQYTLACLPALFVAMININYVFVAGDLNYRCKVPECESEDSTQHPVWWPNSTIDRCYQPVLNEEMYLGNNCTSNSFTGSVKECTEWIYENNNTIVADLDLACQPWKSNLIGSIHNIGMLFSMISVGWISDRFGRKPAIILCAVGSIVGHLKTFMTSYYMYVAVEFVESFVTGGVYPASNVLMIEIIGNKKNRVLSGVIFAYVIYASELIFACLAMFIPYWKTIIRIINSPAIFFLSYIFFLRESLPWQVLNGKTEQAKKTIKDVASMNKININEEELREMDDCKLKQKLNISKYEKVEGFKDIFTSKEILKRLLVVCVCQFTVGFVYYGLMFNSVLLPGSKHTNFLLSTAMSFPGEIIALFVMNRIGRKLPLMVGFLISGATCVASAYVVTVLVGTSLPTTFGNMIVEVIVCFASFAATIWAKITLFLIGKMIIAACYTGIITYTMELFPTSTRGTLLGIGSVMSRTGAMLAPLTPLLTPILADLPSILFGFLSVISGILLAFTPETKELPLMDTIAQVVASVKAARELKKQNKSPKIVTKF